jgi:type VI protein secretion system component Hcp
MAIDGYVYFQDYSGNYAQSESQVAPNVNSKDLMWKPYGFADALAANKGGTAGAPTGSLFELEDFSFDTEQTLNIGSQSTGAGAGKITFNPFSITRKIDRFSPVLFQNSCSGTAFQKVVLGLRKSAGGDTSGAIYLVFIFKLVAVKTMAWSYDDESPKETVTFEYGGLQIHYRPQAPDGSFQGEIAGGWNKVRNISDVGSPNVNFGAGDLIK